MWYSSLYWRIVLRSKHFLVQSPVPGHLRGTAEVPFRSCRQQCLDRSPGEHPGFPISSWERFPQEKSQSRKINRIPTTNTCSMAIYHNSEPLSTKIFWNKKIIEIIKQQNLQNNNCPWVFDLTGEESWPTLVHRAVSTQPSGSVSYFPSRRCLKSQHRIFSHLSLKAI